MTRDMQTRLGRAKRLARTDPIAAAQALASLRRDAPANRHVREALRRLARDQAAPLTQHAHGLAQARKWAELSRFLPPLAAAHPADEDLLRLSAESLLNTGDAPRALRLLRGALPKHGDNPSLTGLLGQALASCGDTTAGEAALASALARGDAGAGVALGLMRQEGGDLAGASAAWRGTVAHDPLAADAWLHLAMFGDLDADPDLCAALAATAQRPDLSPAARICLDFARGNLALAQGDGATGFALLDRANAAQRAASGYDPTRDRALFATIADQYATLPQPAPASPALLFVTGLPRSGTSLVESVLAAHPKVTSGGELPALYRAIAPVFGQSLPQGAQLDRIASAYRTEVASLRHATPVLTDKMPLNFRWIGLLLAALPEARVIHVTRHPVAVATSLYRHHFLGAGNGFAYAQDDIARFMRLERDLMRHWQAQWSEDRLLMLEFDTLVDKPEAAIRRLLDFCALPFDPTCLTPHRAQPVARTASAMQVRAPISPKISGGWQKWQAHMAPFCQSWDAMGGADGPS